MKEMIIIYFLFLQASLSRSELRSITNIHAEKMCVLWIIYPLFILMINMFNTNVYR